MPAPKIKKFLTKNGCGWAVKALEPIPANTFVVEYCGEMLDDAACEQRMWEARARGEQNFYMMQVTPNLIIDAREVASVARLINRGQQAQRGLGVVGEAAGLYTKARFVLVIFVHLGSRKIFLG